MSLPESPKASLWLRVKWAIQDFAAGKYAPLPKVYVPSLTGLLLVLSNWAASGVFDRVELVGAVTTFALAVIGYATPSGDR